MELRAALYDKILHFKLTNFFIMKGINQNLIHVVTSGISLNDKFRIVFSTRHSENQEVERKGQDIP